MKRGMEIDEQKRRWRVVVFILIVHLSLISDIVDDMCVSFFDEWALEE